MSLDVYLNLTGAKREREQVVYVREDGQTRAVSQEQWFAEHPDKSPVYVLDDEDSECVFEYNITHNLGEMASKAYLYYYLWCPDELGITHAWKLINGLRIGLEELESNPARYQRYNPSNGWGTYGGLVEFVRAYLAACEAYPSATVSVSR